MMNSHKTSQKEYYSLNYETYDANITFLDSSRFDKVYKMITEENTGTILEVGCLSGSFLLKLKNVDWNCVGIELSDAGTKGAEKGLHILKYDVEEGLPFKSEIFDIVYAGELIEHLIDTDAFIKETYRILKKHGKFIITTPNIASLINRIRLLFGKYPRYLEYKKGGAGHIHLYNLEKMRNQLEENDFIIEKVLGNFMSFPDPTENKLIRKNILSPLGDLFPTFSENLIIKASKVNY
ncbi:MAG TPA: class I SAM-dependent methyltransferase [Candidatus Methanoperedens sp.]